MTLCADLWTWKEPKCKFPMSEENNCPDGVLKKNWHCFHYHGFSAGFLSFGFLAIAFTIKIVSGLLKTKS